MKNNEKDDKTFGIRLKSIKTLKYAQSELNDKFDTNANPLMEFDSSIGFKVVAEDNQVWSMIQVKITIKETQELFAELGLEYIFEILNFKEVVKNMNEENYKISEVLIHKIFEITTSTTRGILHEKLKGTIGQSEIYPIVSLTSEQA